MTCQHNTYQGRDLKMFKEGWLCKMQQNGDHYKSEFNLLLPYHLSSQFRDNQNW